MILYVGPFLGEFGWELFTFQAHWRWVMKNDPKFHKAFIGCRPGREILYEDFAIVNELPSAAKARGPKLTNVHAVQANRHIIPYGKNGYGKNGHKQLFHKYGDANKAQVKVDVVVHARSRPWRRAENWDISGYEDVIDDLVEEGLTVGVIGLPGQALAFEGENVHNLMGQPLSEVCHTLAAAKCIFGTSSGPMHFASLCGCPQVVISHPKNTRRYKNHWNPFNVDVTMVKGGWQPKAENVSKAIKEMIS